MFLVTLKFFSNKLNFTKKWLHVDHTICNLQAIWIHLMLLSRYNHTIGNEISSTSVRFNVCAKSLSIPKAKKEEENFKIFYFI